MLLDKRLPVKYLFQDLKAELLFVLIVSCVSFLIQRYYPAYIPAIPIPITAFLGTAISVLLSFKMAQSYDRWWEARKVWGSIVNDSRSLTVQLRSFVTHQGAEDFIKTIVHRQIAWGYCLGRSLRGQDVQLTLNEFLSKKDLKELENVDNKPLGIINLNAADIRNLKQENKIDSITHVQLDSTLTRLCDALGRAERINKTVFPRRYRLILKWTIYLFIILLSISLEGLRLGYEVALLMLISFVFLFLDTTAKHLQDPFSNRPTDVSVTAIARTIEINLRQLIGEKDVPKPLEPNDYYLQ